MNLNRITHDVQQGTGPWLRLREGFFTASEAPAALGVSKYVTRSELLRRKYTGTAEDPSPATLAKFRAGHDAEAAARPLAEEICGGELFPVTMSVEVAGLKLLASLDGLSLDGDTVWETKLWNEELAAHVRAGTLPEHYTVQLDQELLVSGARRCLFTCTDGTQERFVSCWYEPSQERFDALLSGWLQFERDLAAYVLPEAPDPAPVGRSPETLPALLIEVTGQVTASNLAEFKATALTAIRSVNRELRTDADFADAEKASKWAGEVESRIAAAKQHALSQTASIDELFRTLDDIASEARAVRLDLEKLVKRRKDDIRAEMVVAARTALDVHVAVVNTEIAPMQLRQNEVDFGGAIKGLKSIASIQDKLDQALAQAKISADAAGRAIRANMATFQQQAAGFEFLFADLGQIVHKAGDDFAALVQSRIATHKAAEERKAREKAEAEARAVEQRRQHEELAAQRAESARLEALAVENRARLAAQEAAAAPAQEPAQSATVSTPPRPAMQAAAALPPADEQATLKLGAICDRLGFVVSAAFVSATLGIKPARTEGAAKMYRESDFARICAALQAHIERVYAAHREEVAA